MKTNSIALLFAALTSGSVLFASGKKEDNPVKLLLAAAASLADANETPDAAPEATPPALNIAAHSASNRALVAAPKVKAKKRKAKSASQEKPKPLSGPKCNCQCSQSETKEDAEKQSKMRMTIHVSKYEDDQSASFEITTPETTKLNTLHDMVRQQMIQYHNAYWPLIRHRDTKMALIRNCAYSSHRLTPNRLGYYDITLPRKFSLDLWNSQGDSRELNENLTLADIKQAELYLSDR
jgi:hypothetical protein